MVTDGPIILAEGLGRTFGNTIAVDHVDLNVPRGEIFGLVGPDGAGKTTLLQLFAAILDPNKGHCAVLGFDTRRDSAAITSRIGYMPQGFTLYQRLSVAENLAFAAKVRNVTTADYFARRGPLLAMAGLEQFAHRREGQLSGGMRKKLALCTNLIHEPPLLLLDEPGLGVDPLSRRELWRMLADFRRRGATVVFSTSYMDEAERCDRVGILDRGRLIAVGSPDELRGRAANAVFGIGARDLDIAEAHLRSWSNVVSAVQKANEVRFVVNPAAGLSRSQRTELEQLGRVEAKEPSIEDAYVVLRPREDGTRTAPTLPLTVARSITSGAAIHITNLTRRFGRFVAVNHISLEISQGEIFGLLGANGAGKTTLIRMLCGLLPPSAGVAHVAGADIARDRRRLRQHIGYMSQRFSLYLDLTSTENLQFFARAYGIDLRRMREAIEWASKAAGLELDRDDLVASLSAGVRQRLALACSVLHRPSVLFLDEPTSGVDPISRFRFWDLVNGLAAAGTTVVVSTHYLDEAAYCHRLGFMHEGRMIALGDLPELRAGLGVDAETSPEDVFISYIGREPDRLGVSQGVAE